jgi:hypothetical protein
MQDPTFVMKGGAKISAFEEALGDNLGDFTNRTVSAKNKVISYYPTLLKEIRLLKLDETYHVKKFFAEFIPDYASILERVLSARPNVLC